MMFKKLKIPLVLILIILILPVFIFSIYEIGTLRKNEQVIESIYNNQLDAIIYSVNQYSEDVLNDWTSSLNIIFKQNGFTNSDELKTFFSTTPVKHCLFTYDPVILEVSPLGTGCQEENLIAELEHMLNEQDSALRKLVTYLRGGYRKIESFELTGTNYLVFLYASGYEPSSRFVMIVFKPDDFINYVLGPKIQEIAREQFNVAIADQRTDSIVYYSERNETPQLIEHRKPMWLLKNYNIGIELKDTTIRDLVKSRTLRNIILISIIDIVLLLGIWLIYRNINKQMDLARLKSDFVSNVSHEIRTPLALIQMYIETLEMGRVQSKEKMSEYYSVILQETQRLTGIVNKILNFSQIESGKRKYSFGDVDLNEVVKKVITSFRLVLDKNAFKVELKLSEDLPLIRADRESVADVLVNLIDNSMKYSDHEKYIRVETYREGKSGVLKVVDKGIGIEQKEQKNIFDKFYRVTEKNLALKAKGSGLGLTIVKHIIDAHRGTIEVKSEKGAGTEFKISLPVSQNE